MKLQFLGHAAFLLESGAHSVLIDPYLTGNPLSAASAEAVRATAILVTHAHGDHIGDTADIARRCGATVYGTVEVMHSLPEDIKTVPAQMCSHIETDFGAIRITAATHGSGVPGGLACGFVVYMEGKKVYHAGDTGLMMDMQLLAPEKIDVALLPIGDHYTMGPTDALRAAEFIRPGRVVPMHYNTMPMLRQDPVRFKDEVEERLGIPVEIMQPGDILEI